VNEVDKRVWCLQKIMFINDRHILAKIIPLSFALHTSNAIGIVVRLTVNKYLETDNVSLASKKNVKSTQFRATTDFLTLKIKTLRSFETSGTVKCKKYSISSSHRLLDLKDQDTVIFRNVGKSKM